MLLSTAVWCEGWQVRFQLYSSSLHSMELTQCGSPVFQIFGVQISADMGSLDWGFL